MDLEQRYGKVLQASAFAARAHQHQRRKDGATPYVSHVFRVCLVVRDVFGFDDPRMLQTALLHDTIEDTTTDFDDLEDNFGAEVAQWVSILTKNKILQEEKREEEYLGRLLHPDTPWQVQACKLADLFDNLMDLVHLPPDKKSKSLSRYRQYFTALAKLSAPELQKPIALVGALLENRTK